VPKWDTTTSKWIMGVDGNGIPDVSDTSNYVRSLGQWNLLANTTEISNIVTDIGNLQTDLANL
jgi:squalene cyclase